VNPLYFSPCLKIQIVLGGDSSSVASEGAVATSDDAGIGNTVASGC
jgi:hypothetical protein